MKITKRLNLTIPIETEKGPIYVHSTPISREVFERYYLVIGQAFNQIHIGGLGIMSGARVAALVVKDLAEKAGSWEGDDGVENGLINEIIRSTNVYVPSPRGWVMITLEEALAGELINDDDASEVKNAIVFFTLISSMVKRDEMAAIMTMATRIWGGQLEPLSCSEFGNSLPTSKGTVSSTGKTAQGSSVPS